MARRLPAHWGHLVHSMTWSRQGRLIIFSFSLPGSEGGGRWGGAQRSSSSRASRRDCWIWQLAVTVGGQDLIFQCIGGVTKDLSHLTDDLAAELDDEEMDSVLEDQAPNPLNNPETPSSCKMVLKQSATPSYLVKMGTTSRPVSRLSMMLLVPCR